MLPAAVATAVVAATTGFASVDAVLAADLRSKLMGETLAACALALDPIPSTEIATRADATRPPNSFTTLLFALAGGRPAGGAQSRTWEFQRGMPVLPLEPGSNRPSARSLSIAEGQI